MSGSNRSSIAATLAEKLATDDDWSQAQVQASDEFELLIHVYPDQADAARDHVESVGGTVEGSYGDTINARARADVIENLANGTSIRKVEELSDPAEHSISEGVSTTNADQLQNLGLDGSNVTVAVIDLKFNDQQSEIADQVVGTIGKDSSYFNTTGAHGTACAEIVAEMAPNANLVLASAIGYFFPNLMDDITSQFDPDVMSMSLGYKQTTRLDGQDDLSNRIIDYTSASGSNTTEGGIFAVSAGNEANGSHFDRVWDTTNNGYLDFDGNGTEFFEVTTTASNQEVVVQSDADWSTDQDYLIEVYDSNQNLISSPSPTTTPAQSVSVPGSATSYIKLKDNGMDGTEHIDIFAWGNYIEFPVSTSERSLGIPATSPDTMTLTTGAVRHNTDDLEAFSSRGPTQDGRRGVDIVAPDGTQSDTYSGEFYGTSAACPHVGGAAALLAEFSEVKNEDIHAALTSMARDITGADGLDGSSVPPPTNRLLGDGYVELDGGLDDLVGLVQKTTLDPANGRAQYSTPAVDTNRVYVGGLGEQVLAYTRSDSSDWTVSRAGDLSDSSPIVVNGTVYVGSGGGKLYALDTNTGSENWSQDVGSAVTSTPTLLSSTVFFGTNDGRVVASDDTASGTIVWETDVGGPVYSALAASNGLVFVTTNDGKLICLDAFNGNEQWRFDTGTTLGASSPTVANGRVYVGADVVYAFDAANTRTKRWEGGYGGTAGSSPAYANGTVYVGSADGSLYAFDDANSGSVQWSQSTGGAIAADPVAPGDRVLAASMDGNLYAYLPDGTQLGSTSLPSETRSTPAFASNDVYVATKNGKLVRH